MSTLVSPSLLAADFTNLRSEIDMINRSEADWLHMDIMDGVFVPNISFGFPVLEAVAGICRKPLDVHFMTIHPEDYIARTAKLGAMMMNVHYEACTHLHRTIQQIHAAGMKAGIWFELEVVGKDSDMVNDSAHLLLRDGKVIISGTRRFWDMRLDWASVNRYFAGSSVITRFR